MLNKRLGQHLLVNKQTLKTEATLCIPKGKKVLEIGPGTGNLTEMILHYKPKILVVVEKDPVMAHILAHKFKGHKNLEIICEDILEYKPKKDDFDIICGNLPYYISSKIIFKVAKMNFSRAVFCLQKEFAERIGAEPGDRKYSRLSVQAGKAFELVYRQDVPRGSFAPPPQVDSQIIVLDKKSASQAKKTPQVSDEFVTAIFSHRKKTLRAALAASCKALGKEKHALMMIADRLTFSDKRVFKLSMEELGIAQKAVLVKQV